MTPIDIFRSTLSKTTQNAIAQMTQRQNIINSIVDYLKSKLSSDAVIVVNNKDEVLMNNESILNLKLKLEYDLNLKISFVSVYANAENSVIISYPLISFNKTVGRKFVVEDLVNELFSALDIYFTNSINTQPIGVINEQALNRLVKY